MTDAVNHLTIVRDPELAAVLAELHHIRGACDRIEERLNGHSVPVPPPKDWHNYRGGGDPDGQEEGHKWEPPKDWHNYKGGIPREPGSRRWWEFWR